jgi:3-hydroxyacyl-CoA dehydrogenase
VEVQDVTKVAIFGAGTMGPVLAQVFATAGYDVTMYSRKTENYRESHARDSSEPGYVRRAWVAIW